MRAVLVLFDKASIESHDYLLSTLFRMMRNNQAFFDIMAEQAQETIKQLERGTVQFMNHFLDTYKKPYSSLQTSSSLASSSSASTLLIANECERLAKENRKRRLHQLELVRQSLYPDFLASIHHDSDEEFVLDEHVREFDMRDEKSRNTWKPKVVLQNLGVLVQVASLPTEKERLWIRDDAEKLAPRGTATLEYQFKIDGI